MHPLGTSALLYFIHVTLNTLFTLQPGIGGDIYLDLSDAQHAHKASQKGKKIEILHRKFKAISTGLKNVS